MSLLLILVLCVGCSKENGNSNNNESSSVNNETETETETESESKNPPIICQYTSAPSYGYKMEMFDFCIRVLNDNKVEVFCTNFEDYAGGKVIKVDNFYSKIYEITEEQKQGIIDIIEKGDIKKLGDCSTDSCDGSYMSIYLFDENCEITHSCGGLNPDEEAFFELRDAIYGLLPDGIHYITTEEAEKCLIKYLQKKYPGEYDNE